MTGGALTADSIATTGAATTVSILVALGTIGGPAGAVAAGIIALGSQIAKLFGGCGQTCIQATAIANQVEPVLQQNLAQYLAAPVHYASLQAGALNNFDTAWAALVQACGNPQLQSAGQNCISDRQQGSCAYKTSPGGWSNGVYTYPGANGSGSSCWNWFIGYRDPIANDPTVVPDPSSASSAVSSITSSLGLPSTVFGIPLQDLLLPGGLLLAALLLPDD